MPWLCNGLKDRSRPALGQTKRTVGDFITANSRDHGFLADSGDERQHPGGSDADGLSGTAGKDDRRDSTGAATPIDNHANESRNTDPEWNRRAMLQPCTFIGRTAFTHDDEGDVGVRHHEALTYVEQTWEADSGAPAMSARLQATGARHRCRLE